MHYPTMIKWMCTFSILWLLCGIFYSNFKISFCKQTVENLIKHQVLQHLIWFCTVCWYPKHSPLGLYWLIFQLCLFCFSEDCDSSVTDDPSATSDASVTDDTSATSDASVTDDTSATSDPSATPDTSLTGDTSVTGDTSATSELSVTGDTSATSDPSVTGDLSVTEDPSVTDDEVSVYVIILIVLGILLLIGATAVVFMMRRYCSSK